MRKQLFISLMLVVAIVSIGMITDASWRTAGVLPAARAAIEEPATPLADHGFSHREWMRGVKATTGIPWSWNETLTADAEVAAIWDRMEHAATEAGVRSYADAVAWLDRHTAEYAELTMYRASARYELTLRVDDDASLPTKVSPASRILTED
jgi:hypothetical protein